MEILEKGEDPETNTKKKARFNPEQFKELIRAQVAANKKSFAIVDAYMGGRFAKELRDKVITPLLREFGQGKIKFYIFWLRETFGFEQMGKGSEGIVLRKEKGRIKESSPYSQDVETITIPVRVILGDDMKMIIEDANSQKPIKIFDDNGKIIEEYKPKGNQTAKDLLIKLLNS